MKHSNKKFKFQSKKKAAMSARRPIDPTDAEQEELLAIQEDLSHSPIDCSIFDDELAEMELHAPSDFLPPED